MKNRILLVTHVQKKKTVNQIKQNRKINLRL